MKEAAWYWMEGREKANWLEKKAQDIRKGLEALEEAGPAITVYLPSSNVAWTKSYLLRSAAALERTAKMYRRGAEMEEGGYPNDPRSEEEREVGLIEWDALFDSAA
jgi:hypothetical protein